MKKKCLFIFFPFIFFTAQVPAQSHMQLGMGYYGENIFNPGFIIQVEKSKSLAQKIQFPLRVEASYYFHKRNHQAIQLNLVSSLRWQAGKRWYTGLGFGLGIMSSWYHSDSGVYEVDDEGVIQSVSNFAGIDFAPSVNLDFGFKLNEQHNNYLWIRPKAYVQMNVNERALLHTAMQIGYSITLNDKKP